MAGKSNKGRNRKGSHPAAVAASSVVEESVQSDVAPTDNVGAVTAVAESATTDAAEVAAVGDATIVSSEANVKEAEKDGNQPKQGESGSGRFFCFFCIELSLNSVCMFVVAYWR